MSNTIKFTATAVAACAIGALGVLAWNGSRPVSVATTDVQIQSPAGHAALTQGRAALHLMNTAERELGRNDMKDAAVAIGQARSRLSAVARAAARTGDPVTIEQEAVVVHQFRPAGDVDAKTPGTTAPDISGIRDVSLIKGDRAKQLALADYTLDFGTISLDTKTMGNQLALARKAALAGRKDAAEAALSGARSAVFIDFEGDQLAEPQT